MLKCFQCTCIATDDIVSCFERKVIQLNVAFFLGEVIQVLRWQDIVMFHWKTQEWKHKNCELNIVYKH